MIIVYYFIMINLKLFKKNPDQIKNKILEKDPLFDVDLLFALLQQHNKIVFEISQLQEKINKLSVFSLQNNEELQKKRDEVKLIKISVQEKTVQLEDIDAQFDVLLLSCPNLTQDDIPVGGKESNQRVKIVGEKPIFDFPIKNHLQLLEKYCGNDIAFGNRIAKSGFFAYKDKLAWLIYRLAMICLKHNEKYGFSVIHVPQVANTKTVTQAGNLPRFKDELFFLENEELVLIPTAEVILASYLENSCLEKKNLPVRLTSWTRCYRKEAGGYGAQERGLIRIHEFEKIEIFSYVLPNEAEKEHNMMVVCVEELLNLFGLHYQVVLLASGDCSFSSSKTYDIELWLPGQQQYKEVSSISNCSDFQSRRSIAKYKNDKNNDLLYTLNGSSLALPRLMVALIEYWQTELGEINFNGLFSLLDKIENNI
jgi:seryl-tRNA synthetase